VTTGASRALVAHLRYATLTEEYDRTLPGYMWHGDWMPRGDVMHLSRTFARRAREALRLECRGLDATEVEEARVYVLKLSHEQARDLLRFLRGV
jgi:hypothetical protein